MGLTPRSLAHRCARLHHGWILWDPPNIRLWGADGPPPWQARLRSSPLLVVWRDKRENGKSVLEIIPDATELAVAHRASQGVA